MKINRSLDPFLLFSVLFWCLLSILVSLNTKAELHLWVNGFHSHFSDYFFKYITHLGDGIFALVVCVALLFVRFKYSLMVLISYVSSGVIVQLGKRFFFSDMKRPSAYFDGIADLYFIEGVQLHSRRTFPSGHSATSFALFATLALIAKNKLLRFCFALIAILVAYSRVYISQHFVEDILVGSIVGTLITYVLFNPLSKLKTDWLDSRLKGL